MESAGQETRREKVPGKAESTNKVRALMDHLGLVDDQAEAGLPLFCMVPKALQQLLNK